MVAEVRMPSVPSLPARTPLRFGPAAEEGNAPVRSTPRGVAMVSATVRSRAVP